MGPPLAAFLLLLPCASAVTFEAPALVCENCSWPSSYAVLRPGVLMGLAHGINEVMISTDGARTWAPTPTAFPCQQQCVRAPDGRLHGFGLGPMPRFDAPDKPQSTFAFPTSRFEAGSGPISVTTEETPIVFELDQGLQCANTSHWGGYPSQCPFWGASSGGHVALNDGQTLLTVIVAFLGGNEGASVNNSGIYALVTNDTLTWRKRSHIVTVADFPNSGEGASENSIARMSNGSLLMVFRVDAGDGQLWIKPPCPDSSPKYPGCLYQNYHRTVSTDEGFTWGAAQEIPNAGAAFPRLLALDGQLILSGGRSVNRGRWDFSLWISTDGLGDAWEEFSLSALHNERIGARASKIYRCTNIAEKCKVGTNISLAMDATINTTEYAMTNDINETTILRCFSFGKWPFSNEMMTRPGTPLPTRASWRWTTRPRWFSMPGAAGPLRLRCGFCCRIMRAHWSCEIGSGEVAQSR